MRTLRLAPLLQLAERTAERRERHTRLVVACLAVWLVPATRLQQAKDAALGDPNLVAVASLGSPSSPLAVAGRHQGPPGDPSCAACVQRGAGVCGGGLVPWQEVRVWRGRRD